MKLIIIGIFIALMALGTSCAQISQPVAEVAPQATSDGIKVHGHWTVTVTDPDGTVDEVHEFENELAKGNFPSSGADLLTALVVGETSITDHAILLKTNGTYDVAHVKCEPTEILKYPGFFYLAATVTRDVAPGTPIRFKASCVFIFEDPQESLTIEQISTSMKIESPIASYNYFLDVPDTLSDRMWAPFTQKNIEGITVQHNQGVFINVVISFE